MRRAARQAFASFIAPIATAAGVFAALAIGFGPVGHSAAQTPQQLLEAVKKKQPAPKAAPRAVPPKGALPNAAIPGRPLPGQPMPGGRALPGFNRAVVPTGPAANLPPQLQRGPFNPSAVNPRALGPNVGAPGGNALRPGHPAAPAVGGRPNLANTKTGPGLGQGPGNNRAFNNPAGRHAPGNPSAKNAPGNPAAKNVPGNPANARTANVGPQGNRPFNQRALGGPDPRRRAVNAPTPAARQVQRVQHRNELFAFRNRLPMRPLPFERNFTGVPPVSERRYVSTELVFQAGPNVSQQRIDELARRLGLSTIETQQSGLTGGTLLQFRVPAGRPVADVVRALETERIGAAQPNYVYEVAQASSESAAEPSAAQSEDTAQSPEQYVVAKLRLAEAHKTATGKNVLIAVIDSMIDEKHPDLGKAIVERLDAAGKPEKPHSHGTGMVGAIVAHGRLTGIAPGATVLAVHAFSTSTKQTPQATTRSIIAGLDWALSKGARIINMSFAGPQDPMLQLAMKRAYERGAILIAAAGNQGPKSPPLYPAADPHVIGVTATDENDAAFTGANRGAYIAVAAPGVNIMAAAPDDAYQLTTGTSVATAHVSGVAALLLERYPATDAKTILEVLTASATRLGTKSRDDEFGWGLIDPVNALAELEARQTDAPAVASPAQPPAPAAATASAPAAVSPAAAGPKPAAAATAPQPRSALPRPGIYMPK